MYLRNRTRTNELGSTRIQNSVIYAWLCTHGDNYNSKELNLTQEPGTASMKNDETETAIICINL